MSNRRKLKVFFFLVGIVNTLGAQERLSASDNSIDSVEWKAGFFANTGSNIFAPYYISALEHGTVTQSKGAYIHGLIEHRPDHSKRFSWGAGLQLFGALTSGAQYAKWNDNGETTEHILSPPKVWIQQFYGSLKYRSLFAELGLKEHQSYLLDNSLTSGDWVESGNARPIPQFRAGFIDFQPIPLTKGWLYVQGEFAYGKFLDNSWLKKFYSYGTSHINLGAWYLYRRLYFRTRPDKNLSFTFGMQAAGQIGGETQWWSRGKLTREVNFHVGLGKLLTSIIPSQEGGGVGEYYAGNNLGSWDLHLRYRIPGDRGIIKLYLQKPWEKGSSIGWQNGWDGLWGLQYDFGRDKCFFNAVLFEYIYLLNQSGPVHFAPHDHPGSTITSDVSGRDDYYNNVDYNAYAYYGVGLGSPFLKAPIYNLDGYPQYVDNLVKGFHLAAKGSIDSYWNWKAALSYRRAYGNGSQPSITPLSDFSWIMQAEGCLRKLPNMKFHIKIAADHGSLLGNNFGALIGLTYHGTINYRK